MLTASKITRFEGKEGMGSKIQVSGSVCGGCGFGAPFLTVHAKKFPLCISFWEMMFSLCVSTATFQQ
jgi:hypothetical protein